MLYLYLVANLTIITYNIKVLILNFKEYKIFLIVVSSNSI